MVESVRLVTYEMLCETPCAGMVEARLAPDRGRASLSVSVMASLQGSVKFGWQASSKKSSFRMSK